MLPIPRHAAARLLRSARSLNPTDVGVIRHVTSSSSSSSSPDQADTVSKATRAAFPASSFGGTPPPPSQPRPAAAAASAGSAPSSSASRSRETKRRLQMALLGVGAVASGTFYYLLGQPDADTPVDRYSSGEWLTSAQVAQRWRHRG
jgi:hypothetical protein